MFELRRSKRRGLQELKLASGIFGNSSRLGDRIELLLRRGREFPARVSASRVAVSAALLLTLAAAASFAPQWIAFAQPERPSFEVASVKPADSLDIRARLQVAPGRLDIAAVTVRNLIQQAYRMSDYRIYGGPPWLGSERYNISAKAGDGAGNLTLDQMRPMLQTLLTDRFHLMVHRETKELPMYRLVVSKEGAKFQRSTGVEQQARMGMGQITDQRSGMNTLASQLGQQLGRFVSNETGLQGDFDFHAEWTPAPGENIGGGDAPPPAGADGPSLFTALRDQLGLELKSAKGPVEVLVVDHAEKPDAN